MVINKKPALCRFETWRACFSSQKSATLANLLALMRLVDEASAHNAVALS
ncbi:hypothetical protein CEV31_1215 [Brucella thiophenivorans]|uniref:Uncharacterized protein n=1 Tax=Brucella thiophenivorans TaxID=571255 RepID=A0A256FY75_9HYPH|nr:hypothetical protein CEV31_1215 [Brucella thiophenivorans]